MSKQITVQIPLDEARKLIDYLGIQNINDIRQIINKYNLALDAEEMDKIMYNLYDEIYHKVIS